MEQSILALLLYQCSSLSYAMLILKAVSGYWLPSRWVVVR